MSISLADHLRRHLAGPVLEALGRADVTNISCNADHVIRVDTHAGKVNTGQTLPVASIYTILNLLADAQGTSLDPEVGFFSAQLPAEEPFHGARLHAVMPGVAAARIFSIRVHSRKRFVLSDFESTEAQRRTLEELVEARQNIVVVGGTSSGKTSLVNTLIDRAVELAPDDRVFVFEDTPELQVVADDLVCLQTAGTPYTLEDLLKSTLRMNPDRIVVGEVRGAEALDLIDAWSTGHSGGFTTAHANDGGSGLRRLNGMARQNDGAGRASFEERITDAVQAVVVMKSPAGIRSIERLVGLGPDGRELILEAV